MQLSTINKYLRCTYVIQFRFLSIKKLSEKIVSYTKLSIFSVISNYTLECLVFESVACALSEERRGTCHLPRDDLPMLFI